MGAGGGLQHCSTSGICLSKLSLFFGLAKAWLQHGVLKVGLAAARDII